MTKPLRIALLTDDFYPNSGGVARSIELQIRELTGLGHQVTLLAPKTFFSPPQYGDYIAMPVLRLPMTPSYLCSIRFGRRQARKIAKNYSFDVVHSQNERGAIFLAAQIARLQNIPHIHTFHSNYAGTHKTNPFGSYINTMTYMQMAPKIMKHYCPDKKVRSVRYPSPLPRVERTHYAKEDWKSVAKLAEYVDMFTSPAPYVINNICNSTHHDLDQNGKVVANGIQTKTFLAATRQRPVDGPIRIISSGRLSPEKRVDAIIEAVGLIDNENVELRILGEGNEFHSLNRLAKKHIKRGSVTFTGHIADRERLAQELADGDIFAFASYRFDTQGMVLAEAACAGLPIVYCDDRLTIGAAPENAILTTPSPTGLSRAIKELIDHPKKRRNMAEKSRTIGKAFTPRQMELKFIEVYERALKNYKD